MRQTDAPDVSQSIPVIISPAAYSLSSMQKTDSTSQDDSNNTNSFANLAPVADRVETSACNRQTRLMSANRCL
eukprot:6352154-Pyramimonas_sp.AAC.1